MSEAQTTTLGPSLQPQKSAGERLELPPKHLRNEAKEKTPNLPVPIGCPLYTGSHPRHLPHRWEQELPPQRAPGPLEHTWAGTGITLTVTTLGVFVSPHLSQPAAPGQGETLQRDCFRKHHFIH